MTDTRLCDICLAAAAAGAPGDPRTATHEDRYADHQGYRVATCDAHALPGRDVRLDAIEESRRCGPELEAMVRRAIAIPTRHPLARDAGGRRP